MLAPKIQETIKCICLT